MWWMGLLSGAGGYRIASTPYPEQRERERDRHQTNQCAVMREGGGVPHPSAVCEQEREGERERERDRDSVSGAATNSSLSRLIPRCANPCRGPIASDAPLAVLKEREREREREYPLATPNLLPPTKKERAQPWHESQVLGP